MAVLSGEAEDYKQRAAKRPDPAPGGLSLGTILLLALIAFLVIRSVSRNSSRQRRRRGLWGAAAAPIFFPERIGLGIGLRFFRRRLFRRRRIVRRRRFIGELVIMPD